MRVLIVSESSHLRSGYAVMTQMLADGLSKLGYTVGEFATHGDERYHPKNSGFNWEYFLSKDGPRPFSPENFDEVCVRFRPEVVLSFRDAWMDAHIPESPAARHFHWVYQPTVDGIPQNPEWLELYEKADLLLTYTPEGKRVLEDNHLPVFSVVPPGVDTELYFPSEVKYQASNAKRLAKSNIGLEEDCYIVGMVARNMIRKLYPDLFCSFRYFLDYAKSKGAEEIANKTKLFVHTCWPDNGWDIPQLILQYGLSSRVIFAYHCKSCGASFLSFWSDARTHCRHCGQYSAGFANNSKGLSESVLADCYRMMDCLVQYACSEGIGIPQAEAALCGTCVFSVDYSGMKDIPEILYQEESDKFRIPAERFITDIWTNRKFALPDNREFAKKLLDFLSLPSPVRTRLERKGYTSAQKIFTKDFFVKGWDTAIKEVAKKQKPKTPQESLRPAVQLPSVDMQISQSSWLELAFDQFGLPVNTRFFAKILSDLQWGSSLSQTPGFFSDMSALGMMPSYRPFTREDVLKILENKRQRTLKFYHSLGVNS